MAGQWRFDTLGGTINFIRRNALRFSALRVLKELEKRAHRDDAAQAFIETPYRNGAMLESIIGACVGETLLTVACDLTLDTEFIATRRVAAWRDKLPELNKRPCVFLLYTPGR